MSLFAKPACPLRLSLTLFLATLMLFFYAQPGLGGVVPVKCLERISFNPCSLLFGETDLDLLELVALALLRKKLETLVEKRSHSVAAWFCTASGVIRRKPKLD